MSQFDPKKPLVMAVFKTVLGHDLQPGTALTIAKKPEAAGEVDEVLGTRLWASGMAVYHEQFSPTPIETRQQEAERLVTLEPLENGWFMIRAPWLRKAEKVQGRKKADRRYQAIVDAGRTDEPPEDDDADQVEEPLAPVTLPIPTEPVRPSEGVVLDPGPVDPGAAVVEGEGEGEGEAKQDSEAGD